MALTETVSQDKKSVDSHKVPDSKKEKPATKVIIRRLPPRMDQETFLNQISPVPNYDYVYMVKGDLSLGENAFSRAYINFTNANDIYDFKEKFDNYVFLDSAGHEFPAVVEFASFQKIPKKRNKIRIDPKCGTIETDPYYLEFVELINKPPEPDEKPEYSLQLNSDNKKDETTPLLEYIKNKRAERLRIREERREERRRREFERKKYKDDDRKKIYEERSPVKNSVKTFTKSQHIYKEKSDADVKIEKESNDKLEPIEERTPEKNEKTSFHKTTDRGKFHDRKKEARPVKYSSKKEYEKREFKNRREDYKEFRPSVDEYKKESDLKVSQKKVKKYSERREERKMEAQKAEQKKLEQQIAKDDTEGEAKPSCSKVVSDMTGELSKKEEPKINESHQSVKEKDSKDHHSKGNEGDTHKRIRNKDRPSIAIYRPGMLSKRKQIESELDGKDGKKE